MKESATTLTLIRKENGAKTNTYQWDLSADGNVLTATANAFFADGTITTSRTVTSRISGSNGFAGRWRDTSYLQRHADLTLKLDNRTVHLSYPNAGQYVDAPFDGADAGVHGSRAPAGMTYSVRMAGRREFLFLTKRYGTAMTQGSLQLSNDGRIITESWWPLGRPTEKVLLVFEKN